MAILNFPTTRPNGSPLQPGDQYAGDNGVNYTFDGVRWLGRTPSLGYTGSTGTQGVQGITGYTGSIGRRWELTSGTTMVSLDSIGTLTFPTGSLIRNGYPGPAGGSGDSSSWFVASTAGGGVASADGKQYVQVDNVGLFMGTNFTTSTGYEWVFGNDGNLTFPNGGKINTTGISGEIDLVAGSALAAASLGSYDLKNYTWVDNSGAYVYTNNANQWKFGLDGVLKFPDTTVQSTAWNPNKDIIFTGNVTFANTTTYSQSTNTVYTDNILEIHAPTGGVDGKWTVNDGKDIGLRFHYYNGTDTNAALYMDNGTWRLKYTIDAVESNGQFSHSGLGDIEARTFYGNVVSTGTVTATNFVGNLTGIATTASYATSFNTGTLVANAVNATTASYATSFNTGTLVRNAVTASIVTLAAQPNITSVGTLTNLQVGGNTNIGGVVNITNTTSATPSSSFTNTGALQVAGATWLGYGTGSGTGNPVIVGPGLINGEPYAALGWDYSTGSTNGAITSWYFTALSRASIVGWTFENSFGLTGDPTKSLKLQNAAASTSTTTGALQVAGGVGVGGSLNVGDVSVVNVNSTNTALRITQLGTGNALVVEDEASPDPSPFVIASNGTVIVGYTSRITQSNLIEVHGSATVNSTPAVGVYSWGTLATGGGLNLYKSRSGTVGTYSTATNGSQSSVRFQFDDGAAFQQAASIIGSVEGTPALNSVPGRLTFSTTPDASVTPLERMRIDSTGQTKFSTAITATSTTTGALVVTGGVGVGGELWATNLRQTSNSVGIGLSAGSNNQGITAIAIGQGAGANTQTSWAIAIGLTAGELSQGSNGIAIGQNAGNNKQSGGAVAIGQSAGGITQGPSTVAIGPLAGYTNQGNGGSYSIALGFGAGLTNQGAASISIGRYAGQNSQNSYAIAIGYTAGQTRQTTGSIILSAGSTAVTIADNAGLYISPIRGDSSDSATNWLLMYNDITKEVTTSNNIVSLSITSAVASTSTITGALTVAGGVGVGGNLYVGGVITATNIYVNGYAVSTSTGVVAANTTGTTTTFVISNTTISTGTTTGALQVVGGVGVGGNLYVGGVITATNIYVNGYAVSTSTGVVAANTTGTTTTFVISNTTISTGTTTGALQVVGGVGVGGNLYVGGTVTATTASIGTITITSSTIYSTNTTTDINFGLMGTMANINMNRKTIFTKDISVVSTASVANLAIQNTTVTASTDTVGTWVLDNTLSNIINPTEIFFNTTGSVMYVAYASSINQYPLPTPWDVTSAVSSSTLSLATVDTAIAGLFISPDGANMIICGNTGVVNAPNGAAVANEDRAYNFTLSVPGDITTAVLTTSTLFTTATGAPAALTSPQGIHFSSDGLTMYVADSTTDYVNQFALSTPYVVNPATYTKRFSIVNEEAGVTSLRFNAAGTRMYIHGTSFKEVNEYRLATPWDIATAVWYDHYFPSYTETSPTGMFISEANNYAYLAGQAVDTVVRYKTDRQAIQVAPETTVSNIILPGNTRIKNAPLYVDGYLQVRGSTTVNALTVNGTLAAAGTVQALTLTGSASSSAISMYSSISTGAITFATGQSTGAVTVGGTAATGNITIGQSTVAQTLNLGTGATAAGSIKVINIGTLGASGSTSTINIGSTVTGALGILTINSTQTIITSTTTSVSTTTGALRVAGGVGVGGALYVNSIINSPNIIVNGSFNSVDWGNTGTGFVALASTYTNLTNTSTIANSSIHAFGIPTIASTTATTITSAATVYIAGGPAAGTNTTITNSYSLRVGAGTANFAGQIQAQSYTIQSTAGIVIQSGVTTVPIANTVATTVNFAGSATTITIGATTGTTTFASVTPSTSTNTGALQVVGGVGIGGGVFVGGILTATTFVGQASPGTTLTNAAAVGYLGMPQISTATSYTLIASDQGKHIYITASGQTVTIPSNAAVPYPIGASIAFIAGPSATTVNIAITTDTMYLGGSGTTGTRTLAAYGMATAVKVATTTWFINGTGLT